ncbi:hypothetical protein D3C78_1177470 [compost metagenome]
MRNSGVKLFRITSMASLEWSCRVKPIDARAAVSAPALVVMIRITLRKSALRPLLSVSAP